MVEPNMEAAGIEPAKHSRRSAPDFLGTYVRIGEHEWEERDADGRLLAVRTTTTKRARRKDAA